MPHYIGVKLVCAEPMERNGNDGYMIKYEDGYESWSPKEVFEKAYFMLDDQSGSKILNSDTQRFFHGYASKRVDEKTTLAKIEYLNGYVDYETSSCADPVRMTRLQGVETAMPRTASRWPAAVVAARACAGKRRKGKTVERRQRPVCQ